MIDLSLAHGSIKYIYIYIYIYVASTLAVWEHFISNSVCSFHFVCPCSRHALNIISSTFKNHIAASQVDVMLSLDIVNPHLLLVQP